MFSFFSLVGSYCPTSLGLMEISSNYMQWEDIAGNMEKLSKSVSIHNSVSSLCPCMFKLLLQSCCLPHLPAGESCPA